MKKMTMLLITLLTALSIYSQDITGDWNGMLKVQGIQLRVVFHIDRTDDGYSGTMDSPDQGAFGIPVSSVGYDGTELVIRMADLGVEYKGTPGMNDTINGTFTQFGQSFPLNLTREEQEKEVLKRPQNPVEPFPYHAEEVWFENKKEGVTLAGTLTMPDKEGRFPAVVLISGSGPQNRDEEVFGHRPFLVLADHLTKNGIAVLRFDDRGIGGSTGDISGATTAQFAGDVKAAVKYLQKRKEINRRQIGLIGHSEGGIIAPLVAADSRKVDFIVLLAGTGIRGDRLILMQQELILRGGGMEEDAIKEANAFTEGAYRIIMQNSDRDSLQSELMAYYKQNTDNLPDSLRPGGSSADAMIASQVNELLSPWMMFFLQHDPAPVLEKVRCPVLAINGEKDLQVPAEVNLEAIEEALHRGGNQKVTIKSLPGLNHLFQECETGLPGEYAAIEQTFSPVALTEITNWILEQVR